MQWNLKMTFFELVVVLLASPLIVVLSYGAYQFHVDPDGATPVFAGKPKKIRTDKKPGRMTISPKPLTISPKPMAG